MTKFMTLKEISDLLRNQADRRKPGRAKDTLDAVGFLIIEFDRRLPEDGVTDALVA